MAPPLESTESTDTAGTILEAPALVRLEALLAATSRRRLGAALAQQRQRAGLELGPAAILAGLGPDELEAIEAGTEHLEVPVVSALLRVYGCSPDALLAPRRALDPALFDGLSDAAVLTFYLKQVKAWRHSKRPQGFRRDDIEILTGILGTDPRAIEDKLQALTGCSPKTARLFRRLMVLGMVVAAGAVAGQGIAAASTHPAAASVPLRAVALAASVGPTAAPAPAVVCATLRAVPVAAAQAGQAGTGTGVTVSVSVLPYEEVQVDQAGQPIAVRTNTGNAPTCAGPWYEVGAHPPVVDAVRDRALVGRVLTAVAANHDLPAVGEWHAGQWYALVA